MRPKDEVKLGRVRLSSCLAGRLGNDWRGRDRIDCILICFTSDQSCSGAMRCGAGEVVKNRADLSWENWIKILTNRSAFVLRKTDVD